VSAVKSQFHIVLLSKPAPPEQSAARPGMVYRLKFLLGGLLIVAVGVGTLIAALVIGSVIAIVLLVTLVIVIVAVILSGAFRQVRQ
jgi:hypothetical protein